MTAATPTPPTKPQPIQGKIALIYDPTKESHIGTASVGDAEAVRLLTISVPRKIAIPGSRTKQKVNVFDTISLAPGANLDIDAALWEAAQVQPLVQQRVAMGVIRVKVPVEVSSSLGELTEYKDGDALELISNNWNIAQLESFLVSEKRNQVRNAINQRIKALREGEAA